MEKSFILWAPFLRTYYSLINISLKNYGNVLVQDGNVGRPRTHLLHRCSKSTPEVQLNSFYTTKNRDHIENSKRDGKQSQWEPLPLMLQTVVGRDSTEGTVKKKKKKRCSSKGELGYKGSSPRTLPDSGSCRNPSAGKPYSLHSLSTLIVQPRAESGHHSRPAASVSPGPLVHTSPSYPTKVAPTHYTLGHPWSVLTIAPPILSG